MAELSFLLALSVNRSRESLAMDLLSTFLTAEVRNRVFV